MLWAWYLDRPPHYTVTAPPPPVPNALDDFVRAAKARRHVLEMKYAEVDWHDLQVATMDARLLAKWKHNRGSAPLPEDIARVDMSVTMAQLLRDNAPAVQMIRAGLRCRFLMPFNAESPKYGWQRWQEANQAVACCSGLLAMRAIYSLRHAPPAVAADALVDFIHFNVLTQPRREVLMVRRRGYGELRDLAPRLSAGEARTVAARMEGIRQIRPSYAAWLEQERPWIVQGMTLGLAQENRHAYYTRLTNWLNVTPCPFRWPWVDLFYGWTVPHALVPARTDRYLKACAKVAKLPVAAHARYPTPSRDCVNWQRFGWDERDREQVGWALWEFQQDCLTLSVAVEGYHKAHGHYPVRLDDIVTDGWITRVPVDPFTQQGQISYRNAGKRFKLYSVGPDGRDDRGRAIVNRVTPEEERNWGPNRTRYLVKVTSEGDVVYSVNERAEDNSNSDRL